MRPHLIVDGDCGFCMTWAHRLAEWLNHDATDPDVVAWQHADLTALGVTESRCTREVVWVGPRGEVAGGAQAFAAWLRHRRGPRRVLGRMLSWPVGAQVAALAYRVIARHRYRLPGGTPACALPTQHEPR